MARPSTRARCSFAQNRVMGINWAKPRNCDQIRFRRGLKCEECSEHAADRTCDRRRVGVRGEEPATACVWLLYGALGVGFPGIFYIFKLATRQEKPPYA